MKLSELIQTLSKIQESSGDLDVIIDVRDRKKSIDAKIGININYHTGYVINSDTKIMRVKAYLENDLLGREPYIGLRKTR